MLLFLALENSFGTWEGYLVGVSYGTMAGLMIGAVEVSLVWLSLGLPLGSSFEHPNNGAYLPDMTLGVPIGLRFSSEAVRCLC